MVTKWVRKRLQWLELLQSVGQSPACHSGLKDRALPQLQHRQQLCLGSIPGQGTPYAAAEVIQIKKRKKKKEKKKKEIHLKTGQKKFILEWQRRKTLI